VALKICLCWAPVPDENWIQFDTGSVVSLDNLDKYSASLFQFEGELRRLAAACNRTGDGYENVETLLRPGTTLLVTSFDNLL